MLKAPKNAVFNNWTSMEVLKVNQRPLSSQWNCQENKTQKTAAFWVDQGQQKMICMQWAILQMILNEF